MKENNLDKYFAEKLRNHQIEPSAQLWDKITQELPATKNKNKKLWFYYGAVASVSAFIVLLTVFLQNHNDENLKNMAINQKTIKKEIIKKLSPDATLAQEKTSHKQDRQQENSLREALAKAEVNAKKNIEITVDTLVQKKLQEDNKLKTEQNLKNNILEENKNLSLNPEKLNSLKDSLLIKTEQDNLAKNLKVIVKVKLSSKTPEKNFALESNEKNKKQNLLVKIRKITAGEYNEQLRKRTEKFFALIGKSNDIEN